MPRVPEYNAPTIGSNALPGVRRSSNASPTLMGGIAAEQLQQAGSGLMAVGQVMAREQIEEQNKVNQVRVNDAMNKAVAAKLKLTYDKDAGYSNLRGEAALNRPDGKGLDDEYGEKLDKELSGIADSLGNDMQRQQFRQQADQMANQFRGGILAHRAKEYTDYELSVQQGTQATAQQQMALAWDDPTALAQSKGAIEAAVYEEGKLRGWSAKQTEATMVERLSRGHTSVLAAAADAGKLDYAREYLKQNGAQMSPEARLAATKVLEAGEFEAKTQGAAESLYGAHKGDVAAALAAAREKYKGKEEDAIVTRIKGLDGERVALRERAQGDAADQAWRAYANGGMRAVPPSVMAAMDGKALEALRRTAKADAEAAIAKREVKTDPNVYYALSAAAGGDPNFKNQDLRPFFDKLSPGDRKHFIDLQTKMDKPEKVAEVVGVGEQKTAVTRALGLKDEQAGIFHQVADKALFAAQQDKGRNLDQDERQKVLDRLVLQGEVVNGSWWRSDPNMRMFEAINSGQVDKFKAEFSEADRNKATAALVRKGIAKPTKQQIDDTLRAAYGTK